MGNTDTKISCPVGDYEFTASFTNGCVAMQAYSDTNGKLFMLEFTDSTLPAELAQYNSAQVVYALMVYTDPGWYNITDDGQLTLNLTVMANYPVSHTIKLAEVKEEIPKLKWQVARLEGQLKESKAIQVSMQNQLLRIPVRVHFNTDAEYWSSETMLNPYVYGGAKLKQCTSFTPMMKAVFFYDLHFIKVGVSRFWFGVAATTPSPFLGTKDLSSFHSANTAEYQSIYGKDNLKEFGTYRAADGDVIRVQVNTFTSIVTWKKLGATFDQLISRSAFVSYGGDIYPALLTDSTEGGTVVEIIPE